MLSNKQSLALCGLLAAGIFIFGILDVLDNFIVLTILTLVFFAIVINLFYSNSKRGQEEQELENK